MSFQANDSPSRVYLFPQLRECSNMAKCTPPAWGLQKEIAQSTLLRDDYTGCGANASGGSKTVSDACSMLC